MCYRFVRITAEGGRDCLGIGHSKKKDGEPSRIEWQGLIETAAAIGVSEAEFWDTTPRYFSAQVKAHDDRLRYEFERVRVSSFLICSPHLKRHATLARFWPSPWDAPKKVEWTPVDPAILANFEAHADETLAQMRKQNGDNQRT